MPEERATFWSGDPSRAVASKRGVALNVVRRTPAISCGAHIDEVRAIVGGLQIERSDSFIALFDALFGLAAHSILVTLFGQSRRAACNAHERGRAKRNASTPHPTTSAAA